MIVYDLSALGTNEVSFYLALEQELLSILDEDIFFLWNISTSIVIGRNQVLQAEVNLEYARQHNIPIYRRPSGGGAIYADNGCFMYSYLTKKRDRNNVYSSLLAKIKSLLASLGLEIVFSGRNDLLFKGRKFSGTAIFQNSNGTILHGTFLYDTNIACLVSALTVDRTKLISKGIKSVEERVINLAPYLTKTKTELMAYFVKNIGDKSIELPSFIINQARQEEKKYNNDAWLWDKNPEYSVVFKKRYSFGSIEAYLLIKQNKVKKLEIRGDFFNKQDLNLFYRAFNQVMFSKEAFCEVLEKVPISDFIFDASNQDFLNLLFEEVL